MTSVVFIGPTIGKADVQSVIDAVCLPPAAQGDVYRAMAHKPHSIGIVDGFFDGVAAVWHKEILWAMSQGVHVFGASSMGALRAAELSEFGMKGIGKIYEDYRCGTLEDDDEVAVIHGPAELDFIALSEPMVSIRATLHHAVSKNILSKSHAHTLCAHAKSLFYAHRTWEALLNFASAHVLSASKAKKLENWLENGRVDQKHLDALAMLEAMREATIAEQTQHIPTFEFEWTNLWDRATSHWQHIPQDEAIAGDADTQLVLDELRLQPDEFATVRDAAMLRQLALQDSENPPAVVDRQSHVRHITAFRKQQNLLTRENLDCWLQENSLSGQELEDVLAEDLHVRNSLDIASRVFDQHVLKVLKLKSNYHALSQRARCKSDKLKAIDHTNTRPEDIDLPRIVLLNWYFCHRLEHEIPEDIESHIGDLGLESREEFYQMLVREYLFVQNITNK